MPLAGLVLVVVAGAGMALHQTWLTRSQVNATILAAKADMLAVAGLDAALLKHRGYVA